MKQILKYICIIGGFSIMKRPSVHAGEELTRIEPSVEEREKGYQIPNDRIIPMFQKSSILNKISFFFFFCIFVSLQKKNNNKKSITSTKRTVPILKNQNNFSFYCRIFWLFIPTLIYSNCSTITLIRCLTRNFTPPPLCIF